MDIGGRDSRPGPILVADDSAAMRHLVAASLEGLGREVIEALDGNEAWVLLQEHRPALAILDVFMPPPTGLELLRAIRADPTLCSIRVIVLTAASHPEVAQAVKAAGADSYILKPYSPSALREEVRALLGQTQP
jgi:CheY-like chemotaxis protein